MKRIAGDITAADIANAERISWWRIRRWFRSAAARWPMPSVTLEDLDQVARIAVFRASQRFKPEKGVRFTSYAPNCALGEAMRYCAAAQGVPPNAFYSGRAADLVNAVSLDEEFEEDCTLVEILPDPRDHYAAVHVDEQVTQVLEALPCLHPKLRKIVHLRYFEDRTLAEIARSLGCSRENVRRLLERAVIQIRREVQRDP